MMAHEGAELALVWAGTGAMVTGLVGWVIKRIFSDLNSAVTDHAVQGATRVQVESLREEILRLEEMVIAQSGKLDQLNNEIMKLRLAFIDEQSALLRVLGEFNVHGDDAMRSRISIELEAANRRRNHVMNGMSEANSQ